MIVEINEDKKSIFKGGDICFCSATNDHVYIVEVFQDKLKCLTFNLDKIECYDYSCLDDIKKIDDHLSLDLSRFKAFKRTCHLDFFEVTYEVTYIEIEHSHKVFVIKDSSVSPRLGVRNYIIPPKFKELYVVDYKVESIAILRNED